MPKHGLNSAERRPAKRVKNADAVSRSATPADTSGSVPFFVKYPEMDKSKKLSKKLSKRDKNLQECAELQVSPFVLKGAKKDGELDVWYTVIPYEEWDSMKKYSNFIIQQETYKNNEFVYVKGAKDKGDDPKDFWIARILQVRARDPQHVYALVTWMYWPEELPATKPKPSDQISPHFGKRKYHANNELVASNYLEVLDVLSFAGKVDVVQWTEEGDVDDQPKTLFWRQTLNKETDELSDIRNHCICTGHWNPDQMMYVCDNPECRTMLHPECLTDLAAKKKYEELHPQSVANSFTNGGKSKATPPPHKAAPWTKKFKAKIVALSDDPDHPNTKMVVRDLQAGGGGGGGGRKEKEKEKSEEDGEDGEKEEKKVTMWEESVVCPKCGTVME